MSNEEKFVHELVESGELKGKVCTYYMLMQTMWNVFGNPYHDNPSDCYYEMLTEKFEQTNFTNISAAKSLTEEMLNCIETIYNAFEKYIAYKEFCEEHIIALGEDNEVPLGVGVTNQALKKGSLPVIDIEEARALLGIEYFPKEYRTRGIEEYVRPFKDSYEYAKDCGFDEEDPKGTYWVRKQQLYQMYKRYCSYYKQCSSGDWDKTYGCEEIQALISDEDKSQVKTPWQKVASAGEKTGNKTHDKKNHHAEITNQELKDVKARDKNQLKNDLEINL